jgi:hypothetical protein
MLTMTACAAPSPFEVRPRRAVALGKNKWPQATLSRGFESSSVVTFYAASGHGQMGLVVEDSVFEWPTSLTGRIQYVRYIYFDCFLVACPTSLLLTLSLPLGMSHFTHFRFPLWSYFAWTALVAAELAYYLR